MTDGCHRGVEGICVGDDLIARTDAKCLQGNQQCVGSAVDAAHVRRAEIVCELAFESRNVLGQDVVSVQKHPADFVNE